MTGLLIALTVVITVQFTVGMIAGVMVIFFSDKN